MSVAYGQTSPAMVAAIAGRSTTDNCIQIFVDALDRSAYYLNHKVSRLVYFDYKLDYLAI